MKYYLYARKSSDSEERQMLSIDAQLSELREFALKERLTIDQEFIETQTAKDPGRPVFNAMMTSIESSDVSGIIAWHPDRLARNSIDGGKIIYDLDTGKLKSLKSIVPLTSLNLAMLTGKLISESDDVAFAGEGWSELSCSEIFLLS